MQTFARRLAEQRSPGAGQLPL